jgi:hypothetical protein
MKEAWISAFIDDELKLDEKIGFVETVHKDRVYKEETVGLLRQEQMLRGAPVDSPPPVVYPLEGGRTRAFEGSRPQPWLWLQAHLRPLSLGLATLAILLMVWIHMAPRPEIASTTMSKSHRFVIYRPDIARAEISGTFTDWCPVGMQRLGDSGYWEVQLELPGGEHRFAYILNGTERITDPTILIREKDDFGGENSILTVSL